MFSFHKRYDVKKLIKRYNAIIDANPVPSADEIPFWLCEDDVFHDIFDGQTDEDGNNPLFNLVNSSLRNVKMSEVKNLVVKNPNVLKRRRRQKTLILDLRAEDDEGVIYDIEVQKRNRPGFWDRMFAYGDRLRAEQLNEGDDYTSLRRVVVIAFVTFPIRGDNSIGCDVYRETSQFDPSVTYDGKTTIFIRVPTSKDQKLSRIEDPELAMWLKMFGYPKLTTEEDVNFLAKAYPVVKKVREKMWNFFGLLFGGEVRRMELALAEGYGDGRTEGYRDGRTEGFRDGRTEGYRDGRTEGFRDGRTEGYRDGREDGYGDGRLAGQAETTRSFVVRTLRRRFPNENESLFTTCARKLETKNAKELDDALDRSEVCSTADEFVNTL